MKIDGFTTVKASDVKWPPPPTQEQIDIEFKLREENDELERLSRRPLLALMFPDCYSSDIKQADDPFGVESAGLEDFFWSEMQIA